MGGTKFQQSLLFCCSASHGCACCRCLCIAAWPYTAHESSNQGRAGSDTAARKSQLAALESSELAPTRQRRLPMNPSDVLSSCSSRRSCTRTAQPSAPHVVSGDPGPFLCRFSSTEADSDPNSASASVRMLSRRSPARREDPEGDAGLAALRSREITSGH